MQRSNSRGAKGNLRRGDEDGDQEQERKKNQKAGSGRGM